MVQLMRSGQWQWYSFFEEVNVTKTRDHAVQTLEELAGDRYGDALNSLNHALELSNHLVDIEYMAMRLVLNGLPLNRDGLYTLADLQALIDSITE